MAEPEMAEPAPRLVVVPPPATTPAAPPSPLRTRPVLFSDFIAPISHATEPLHPADRREIGQILGSAFFVAALILGCAVLWVAA